MTISRQQRRAQARRETKEQFTGRVFEEVTRGVSIQQLWRVYYRNRFELRADPALTPEMEGMIREVFYAGVATMMQLNNKIASEIEDVDEGAMAIQRLVEELETYTDSLK